MSYKKFDQADLEVIKNIIKDDERILYAENINEEYSHDELGGAQSYPDVVVKATSAEEISEIMKYAYENNICLLYTSPSPRDRQKSRMPSSA